MGGSSAEYMREWRAKNAEHVKAYAQRWLAENPHYHKAWKETNRRTIRAQDRSRRLENPELFNAQRRFQRYGITPDQFKAMFDEQNGVCAICFLPETRIIKGTLSALSVDHCHQTGKIRALLCHRCNRTLGAFEDDPGRFERAATYLRSHKAGKGAVKEGHKARKKRDKE